MPDNPAGGGNGKWGCFDVPFVGEICASDALGLITGGDGGGGPISGIVPTNGALPSGVVPKENGNGNGSVSPGQLVDGCIPVLPVAFKQRAVAPKGYVVVTEKDGSKVAMLKTVARACGKWKPARKPPIKASDWRCLMRADATVRKLDRVQKAADKIRKKRTRR